MLTFLAAYSANLFWVRASFSGSSSSSSEPNKSTSSSSSASVAGAAAGFTAAAATSGPYVEAGAEASPGRVVNSSAKEAMCLYQRAAWGYFPASGDLETPLKTTTSAWEGEVLFNEKIRLVRSVKEFLLSY